MYMHDMGKCNMGRNVIKGQGMSGNFILFGEWSSEQCQNTEGGECDMDNKYMP